MSVLLSISPLIALADSSSQEPGNEYNEYIDVDKTDWFYESVMYCLEKGIFSGTGENAFSPDTTLTRAMYVTVLGRIAGVDTSQYATSSFNDVAVGEWYAPYVAWAAEKGITQGTGKDTFSPDEALTREQMATMTVRFFKSLDISYEAEEQTKSGPGDTSAISSWALDSVLSLWYAGLLTGDENGNCNPTSKATRAEAAAFCMRISKTVKEQEEKEEPTPSQDPGSGYGTTYTITFETNGGNPISPVSLSAGTRLGTLPVPFKLGAIFNGWFYDSECKSEVQSTDVLTRSLTLYAKFTDTGAPVQMDTPRYASALNQNPDFTIVVLADGKSPEEVKAAITAENLYAPDQTDIIKVTGSGGSFTVSAKNGTFEEGASYKLTLTDDALRFNGYADTVRTFTFSIVKKEVMKLGLSDSLKYLPASEVSNMTMNGSGVSKLSVPLVTLGTDISTVDYDEGTFDYYGEPGFNVGDVVAIYEGVLPNTRNINDKSGKGAVAYVEITEVNKPTYSYKTAKAMDVLFTPDVLPVNIADDEDGNKNNDTIIIDKDKMFFGDDKYAVLKLNAETSVDEGDFISFYSGSFGAGMESEGYGQIIGVAEDEDDNYIITFEFVDLNVILNAASLYDTGTLGGEELLENVDIDALEAGIEAQAMESGFAEQAAEYLSDLALQTESFTRLDLDMMPGSFSVTAEDGRQLSRSDIRSLAAQTPQVGHINVNASIGYSVPHFGNAPGTSCYVTVSFELTFGNDEKAVVIRVTGTFIEEVKIETNLSVDIKFEWFFIIPYPVDFVADAGFEFYTYTGIIIDASIFTEDQPNGMNIGSELEKLLDSVDNTYNKQVKDSLIERYQQMLQNDSDWIDLFSKEIFKTEGSIDPFHIVAYGIKLEFKVAANVNVSLGCDFSHKSAKGYYYSISLASKTATSRQADLVEERQEFTFYVLGTIGLRAGVELSLELGLFSVELDSIGISAEVGVYVQLWGYFYYRYVYSAYSGSEEKYAGALYIELGIYLEIKFFAQALNEKYKFEYDIYSNEWPLWSAGSEESVLDFAYDDSEVPVLTMCGSQRTLRLDNKLFTMSQMNLKSGEDSGVVYDDSSDFTIEITNAAFTYDASTNKLTVAPPEGVSKLTGEMIITLKNAPLVFTSSPISRTIPLYWDTSVGSVAVVPYELEPTEASEPSYMYSVISGETFDLPEELKNPRWWLNEFLFDGWYTDADFTRPQSLPFIMPEDAESITLYAKWIPNPQFPYHIDKYMMNTDGVSYTLSPDLYYGEARTLVDISDKITTIAGFTIDPGYPTQLFISSEHGYYADKIPNGVASVYYTRNSHIVTYHMLPDGADDIEIRVYQGGAIAQPHYVRPGYDFDGWDAAIPDTMPDADGLEFTAKWKARSDTAFRLEHYVEKPGSPGEYIYIGSEKKTDTTDTTLTAADYRLISAVYNYDHATVKGQTVTEATLSGDGSLIIKLYYQYSSDTASYTVRHVRQSVSGSYSEAEGAVVFEEIKTDMIGDLTEAAPRSYGIYKGFTPGSFTQKTIEADGTTVVTILYSRNSYTVTWNAGEGSFADGSNTVTQTVKYGAAIVRPENPTLEGMIFMGWMGGIDLGSVPTMDSQIMPDYDLEYEARWEYPAEGDTITVYFETSTETNPDARQLTVGQPYGDEPLPEPGELEGYTFAGWYTEIADQPITNETNVTIAADHTLYAYWIPNEYQIGYWLEGGANDPANPPSYKVSDGVITLKAPTRNGYTFVGWVDLHGDKVEEDEAIPVGTWGYVYFEAFWEEN
jgi:uncharacterized repeat protein (TIGR02543 family)